MSLQRTYTKSQLEELIYSQLENLNAMNDLISIMRHQNDLLKNAMFPTLLEEQESGSHDCQQVHIELILWRYFGGK